VSKRDALLRLIADQQEDDPDIGPIVPLDAFFDGNEDAASIGCNLSEHPGMETFYRVLRDVRARNEVQDVLVGIQEVMEGDDEWPFSDVVFILTSASSADIARWLEPLQPDEIIDGWGGDKASAAPDPVPGMSVFRAWWD
jgi:hypothetical protein